MIVKMCDICKLFLIVAVIEKFSSTALFQLLFDPQEGELFCNVLRQQLDNSEEVDNLIQRQVLTFYTEHLQSLLIVLCVHVCVTAL